ncbi:hypothetical protein [Aquimarina algiphila]|uniref:hypothetical protein n=1 Tax=Aquimarina algiphila TaxID=2047982 RepID=UPI0024931971|nr:hypothetical protein [Aquimarina algiphila]
MWHTSETLAAAREITVEKSRIVLFEKTIDAVVNATETENVKFEGESIPAPASVSLVASKIG